MPLCYSYQAFVALAVCFGFTVSGFIALQSIVIVQLFGIENLTDAFGYLMWVIGIAVSVGPPFSGFLYDQTETYHIPFYVAGALLAKSSIFCCIALYRQKKKQRKELKFELDGFTNTAMSEIDLK